MRTFRPARRRIELEIQKSIKNGVPVIDLASRDYLLKDLSDEEGTVERCYAKSLGNCRGPISKEHFISENILIQIGELKPSGIPWMAQREDPIAPGDLAANCLCKYHNEFLSPLDSIAGKFFESIPNFMNPNSPSIFIWGPSLERWFLKLLLGLIGTKQILVNERKVASKDIDPLWVRVLFGLEEFPKGTGLYIQVQPGQKLTFQKQVSAATLILDNEIKGVRASLGGIEFYLSLVPKEKGFKTDHPGYGNTMYRFRGINRDDAKNQLKLYWD